MTAQKRSGRDSLWTVLTAITGLLILIGLYLSLLWAPEAANLSTANER